MPTWSCQRVLLAGAAALLLLPGCAAGLFQRTVSFEAAHRRCADLGWRWQLDQVEEGTATDSGTGELSGGVLVTYTCRRPGVSL